MRCDVLRIWHFANLKFSNVIVNWTFRDWSYVIIRRRIYAFMCRAIKLHQLHNYWIIKKIQSTVNIVLVTFCDTLNLVDIILREHHIIWKRSNREYWCIHRKINCIRVSYLDTNNFESKESLIFFLQTVPGLVTPLHSLSIELIRNEMKVKSHVMFNSFFINPSYKYSFVYCS